MLKVKITNPTAIGRSYAWLPGGLRLAPGESKVVPFDPFTAANKQVYVELCNRDLKLGFVTFTYIVEAPCKVDPTAIIDNEVAKPVEVKETKKKANNAEQAIAATISPASTKSTTATETTKAAAVNTVADNDMEKRYFRKYTIPTIMQ